VPQLPGFSIAGISEPSRQVGGDYYDFLRLPDSKLGIAVGDVSGKGIPAALLMSNLQASLKGQILHGGSVSRTVSLVNHLLVSSTDTNMFATFFYGELDPEKGTFTSSNAGHDPPILCRADGSIERISTGGLILGVMDETNYEESTLRMNEGDVLVVYTDGITEAQGPLPQLPPPTGKVSTAGGRRGGETDGARGENADGARGENADGARGGEAGEVQDDRVNLFEEERLIDVIRANRGRNAQEIERAILDAVKRHVADIPQSDDITLVVIKRDSNHS
ncbi:MAG TPA: PP2C family protein-serine/threonine phosphatase, partial [Candidatus Krumholzibacteria bacterium]|nr:PP2C family protein-serine/threonine phosphatase [Candidatus Krumholzibacteria bacterium]